MTLPSEPYVNEDGVHIGLVKNVTDKGFTLVMTREQAIRLLGEETVSKAEKNRLSPTIKDVKDNSNQKTKSIEETIIDA